MYILVNEDNKPFAIITKPLRELIVKAIEEEYMVKEVEIKGIPNPDWGEVKEFSVKAKSVDDDEEVGYTLEISRIVAY